MSTLDTSGLYLLTNGRSGASKALSSASNGRRFVFMKDVDNGQEQQWFFIPTREPSRYRLSTIAAGTSLSLDVVNDKGENSTRLQLSNGAGVSGQFWTLSPVSPNVFRITNDFTGPDRPLGGFKRFPIARLINKKIGVNDAQLWTLSRFSTGTNPVSSTDPPALDPPDPTPPPAVTPPANPDLGQTSDLEAVTTGPATAGTSSSNSPPLPPPPPPATVVTSSPAAANNLPSSLPPVSVSSIGSASPTSTINTESIANSATLAVPSPPPTSTTPTPAPVTDPSSIPDFDPDFDPDVDPDTVPGPDSSATSSFLPPSTESSSPSQALSSNADAPILPSSQPNITQASSSNPRGLPPGAVAGIIIGLVVFSALCIAGLFYFKCFRRRIVRAKKKPVFREPEYGPTPPSTGSRHEHKRNINLTSLEVSSESKKLFGVVSIKSPRSVRSTKSPTSPQEWGIRTLAMLNIGEGSSKEKTEGGEFDSPVERLGGSNRSMGKGWK